MSDAVDAGVSVDTGTTTAVDVPESVTDKSSERFSATPPPSSTLSPALQPGPTPASPSPANDPAPAETPASPEPVIAPPQPEDPGEIVRGTSHGAGTPVVESPKEVPLPTQASHAPTTVTIKDRAYAALEKIRFNKRRKLDKIVALPKEKGRIKNDDVEKLLRVSDSTAQRYLNQLVVAGRLRRLGQTKDITYQPV